jgi:phospholipase C
MLGRLCALACTIVFIAVLGGCVGVAPIPKGDFQLTVTTTGAGDGTVTSSPAGIDCTGNTGTCTADFSLTTTVTLTATPTNPYTFVSWTGTGCSGSTNPCSVSVAGNTSNATAAFGATLNSINHIIFLAQENRSFDEYVGAMRGYWAAAGIPDQPFDGLAQFNPPANPAAAPTNPGCDPAFPYPPNTFCQINSASPSIASFHMTSTCVENPSPSWAEAHRDWNVSDPVSATATLDGFVEAAAHDARQHVDNNGQFAPYFDVEGHRAMGYYDWNDLNYYYSLATTFSTSDAWFSPVMTRTPPNREFMIAGTSNGYVYQRGANPPLDTALIPAKTIFEEAQNQGISWKIYVPTAGTACATPPADTDPACLIRFSYLHDFVFGQTIRNNPSQYTNNIVNISQFYNDAKFGNLPQIAQIEPSSANGLDEHPTDNDPPPGTAPCCNLQLGANFVSSLINAVMCGQPNPPNGSCTAGPSWADSVFILTWDEFGGFYDHVASQPTVSPDGIPPVDLFPNDPCYQNPTAGPTCDFTYTGYRVPVMVVSPYSKANFVAHMTNPARDYTAILKLIETRFGLNNLTQRDAAQVPMDDPTTGFFDFTNIPWKVPPTLPKQTVLPGSSCFLNPPP